MIRLPPPSPPASREERRKAKERKLSKELENLNYSTLTTPLNHESDDCTKKRTLTSKKSKGPYINEKSRTNLSKSQSKTSTEYHSNNKSSKKIEVQHVQHEIERDLSISNLKRNTPQSTTTNKTIGIFSASPEHLLKQRKNLSSSSSSFSISAATPISTKENSTLNTDMHIHTYTNTHTRYGNKIYEEPQAQVEMEAETEKINGSIRKVSEGKLAFYPPELLEEFPSQQSTTKSSISVSPLKKTSLLMKELYKKTERERREWEKVHTKKRHRPHYRRKPIFLSKPRHFTNREDEGFVSTFQRPEWETVENLQDRRPAGIFVLKHELYQWVYYGTAWDLYEAEKEQRQLLENRCHPYKLFLEERDTDLIKFHVIREVYLPTEFQINEYEDYLQSLIIEERNAAKQSYSYRLVELYRYGRKRQALKLWYKKILNEVLQDRHCAAICIQANYRQYTTAKRIWKQFKDQKYINARNIIANFGQRYYRGCKTREQVWEALNKAQIPKPKSNLSSKIATVVRGDDKHLAKIKDTLQYKLRRLKYLEKNDQQLQNFSQDKEVEEYSRLGLFTYESDLKNAQLVHYVPKRPSKPFLGYDSQMTRMKEREANFGPYVTKITAVFRGYLARKFVSEIYTILRKRRIKRNRAADDIQLWYRSCVKMRECMDLKTELLYYFKSAQKIQKIMRGYLARKYFEETYGDLVALRNYGATTFQRLGRGWRDRNYVQNLRRQKKLMEIASVIARFMDRSRHKIELIKARILKKKNKNMILIQRNCRIWLSRRVANALRIERHRNIAAATIQRNFRHYRTRIRVYYRDQRKQLGLCDLCVSNHTSVYVEITEQRLCNTCYHRTMFILHRQQLLDHERIRQVRKAQEEKDKQLELQVEESSDSEEDESSKRRKAALLLKKRKKSSNDIYPQLMLENQEERIYSSPKRNQEKSNELNRLQSRREKYSEQKENTVPSSNSPSSEMTRVDDSTPKNKEGKIGHSPNVDREIISNEEEDQNSVSESISDASLFHVNEQSNEEILRSTYPSIKRLNSPKVQKRYDDTHKYIQQQHRIYDIPTFILYTHSAKIIQHAYKLFAKKSMRFYGQCLHCSKPVRCICYDCNQSLCRSCAYLIHRVSILNCHKIKNINQHRKEIIMVRRLTKFFLFYKQKIKLFAKFHGNIKMRQNYAVSYWQKLWRGYRIRKQFPFYWTISYYLLGLLRRQKTHYLSMYRAYPILLQRDNLPAMLYGDEITKWRSALSQGAFSHNQKIVPSTGLYEGEQLIEDPFKHANPWDNNLEEMTHRQRRKILQKYEISLRHQRPFFPGLGMLYRIVQNRSSISVVSSIRKYIEFSKGTYILEKKRAIKNEKNLQIFQNREKLVQLRMFSALTIQRVFRGFMVRVMLNTATVRSRLVKRLVSEVCNPKSFMKRWARARSEKYSWYLGTGIIDTYTILEAMSSRGRTNLRLAGVLHPENNGTLGETNKNPPIMTDDHCKSMVDGKGVISVVVALVERFLHQNQVPQKEIEANDLYLLQNSLVQSNKSVKFYSQLKTGKISLNQMNNSKVLHLADELLVKNANRFNTISVYPKEYINYNDVPHVLKIQLIGLQHYILHRLDTSSIIQKRVHSDVEKELMKNNISMLSNTRTIYDSQLLSRQINKIYYHLIITVLNGEHGDKVWKILEKSRKEDDSDSNILDILKDQNIIEEDEEHSSDDNNDNDTSKHQTKKGKYSKRKKSLTSMTDNIFVSSLPLEAKSQPAEWDEVLYIDFAEPSLMMNADFERSKGKLGKPLLNIQIVESNSPYPPVVSGQSTTALYKKDKNLAAKDTTEKKVDKISCWDQVNRNIGEDDDGASCYKSPPPVYLQAEKYSKVTEIDLSAPDLFRLLGQCMEWNVPVENPQYFNDRKNNNYDQYLNATKSKGKLFSALSLLFGLELPKRTISRKIVSEIIKDEVLAKVELLLDERCPRIEIGPLVVAFDCNRDHFIQGNSTQIIESGSNKRSNKETVNEQYVSNGSLNNTMSSLARLGSFMGLRTVTTESEAKAVKKKEPTKEKVKIDDKGTEFKFDEVRCRIFWCGVDMGCSPKTSFKYILPLADKIILPVLNLEERQYPSLYFIFEGRKKTEEEKQKEEEVRQLASLSGKERTRYEKIIKMREKERRKQERQKKKEITQKRKNGKKKMKNKHNVDDDNYIDKDVDQNYDPSLYLNAHPPLTPFAVAKISYSRLYSPTAATTSIPIYPHPLRCVDEKNNDKSKTEEETIPSDTQRRIGMITTSIISKFVDMPIWKIRQNFAKSITRSYINIAIKKIPQPRIEVKVCKLMQTLISKPTTYVSVEWRKKKIYQQKTKSADRSSKSLQQDASESSKKKTVITSDIDSFLRRKENGSTLMEKIFLNTITKYTYRELVNTRRGITPSVSGMNERHTDGVNIPQVIRFSSSFINKREYSLPSEENILSSSTNQGKGCSSLHFPADYDYRNGVPFLRINIMTSNETSSSLGKDVTSKEQKLLAERNAIQMEEASICLLEDEVLFLTTFRPAVLPLVRWTGPLKYGCGWLVSGSAYLEVKSYDLPYLIRSRYMNPPVPRLLVKFLSISIEQSEDSSSSLSKDNPRKFYKCSIKWKGEEVAVTEKSINGTWWNSTLVIPIRSLQEHPSFFDVQTMVGMTANRTQNKQNGKEQMEYLNTRKSHTREEVQESGNNTEGIPLSFTILEGSSAHKDYMQIVGESFPIKNQIELPVNYLACDVKAKGNKRRVIGSIGLSLSVIKLDQATPEEIHYLDTHDTIQEAPTTFGGIISDMDVTNHYKEGNLSIMQDGNPNTDKSSTGKIISAKDLDYSLQNSSTRRRRLTLVTSLSITEKAAQDLLFRAQEALMESPEDRTLRTYARMLYAEYERARKALKKAKKAALSTLKGNKTKTSVRSTEVLRKGKTASVSSIKFKDARRKQKEDSRAKSEEKMKSKSNGKSYNLPERAVSEERLLKNGLTIPPEIKIGEADSIPNEKKSLINIELDEEDALLQEQIATIRNNPVIFPVLPVTRRSLYLVLKEIQDVKTTFSSPPIARVYWSGKCIGQTISKPRKSIIEVSNQKVSLHDPNKSNQMDKKINWSWNTTYFPNPYNDSDLHNTVEGFLLPLPGLDFGDHSKDIPGYFGKDDNTSKEEKTPGDQNIIKSLNENEERLEQTKQIKSRNLKSAEYSKNSSLRIEIWCGHEFCGQLELEAEEIKTNIQPLAKLLPDTCHSNNKNDKNKEDVGENYQSGSGGKKIFGKDNTWTVDQLERKGKGINQFGFLSYRLVELDPSIDIYQDIRNGIRKRVRKQMEEAGVLVEKKIPSMEEEIDQEEKPLSPNEISVLARTHLRRKLDMYLQVTGCSHLPKMNAVFGSTDCIVKISYGGKDLGKTQVVINTLFPIFNEGYIRLPLEVLSQLIVFHEGEKKRVLQIEQKTKLRQRQEQIQVKGGQDEDKIYTELSVNESKSYDEQTENEIENQDIVNKTKILLSFYSAETLSLSPIGKIELSPYEIFLLTDSSVSYPISLDDNILNKKGMLSTFQNLFNSENIANPKKKANSSQEEIPQLKETERSQKLLAYATQATIPSAHLSAFFIPRPQGRSSLEISLEKLEHIIQDGGKMGSGNILPITLVLVLSWNGTEMIKKRIRCVGGRATNIKIAPDVIEEQDFDSEPEKSLESDSKSQEEKEKEEKEKLRIKSAQEQKGKEILLPFDCLDQEVKFPFNYKAKLKIEVFREIFKMDRSTEKDRQRKRSRHLILIGERTLRGPWDLNVNAEEDLHDDNEYSPMSIILQPRSFMLESNQKSNLNKKGTSRVDEIIASNIGTDETYDVTKMGGILTLKCILSDPTPEATKWLEACRSLRQKKEELPLLVIHSATNLGTSTTSSLNRSSACSPCCIVYVNGVEIGRTTTIKDTPYPVFGAAHGEEFSLPLSQESLEADGGEEIVIQVVDKHNSSLSSYNILGQIKMTGKELLERELRPWSSYVDLPLEKRGYGPSNFDYSVQGSICISWRDKYKYFSKEDAEKENLTTLGKEANSKKKVAKIESKDNEISDIEMGEESPRNFNESENMELALDLQSSTNETKKNGLEVGYNEEYIPRQWLRLHIFGCRDLFQGNVLGARDPYFIVLVNRAHVVTSRTIWRTSNPFWDEYHKLIVEEEDVLNNRLEVRILVFDKSVAGEDDFLGQAILQKESILESNGLVMELSLNSRTDVPTDNQVKNSQRITGTIRLTCVAEIEAPFYKTMLKQQLHVNTHTIAIELIGIESKLDYLLDHFLKMNSTLNEQEPKSEQTTTANEPNPLDNGEELKIFEEIVTGEEKQKEINEQLSNWHGDHVHLFLRIRLGKKEVYRSNVVKCKNNIIEWENDVIFIPLEDSSFLVDSYVDISIDVFVIIPQHPSLPKHIISLGPHVLFLGSLNLKEYMDKIVQQRKKDNNVHDNDGNGPDYQLVLPLVYRESNQRPRPLKNYEKVDSNDSSAFEDNVSKGSKEQLKGDNFLDDDDFEFPDGKKGFIHRSKIFNNGIGNMTKSINLKSRKKDEENKEEANPFTEIPIPETTLTLRWCILSPVKRSGYCFRNQLDICSHIQKRRSLSVYQPDEPLSNEKDELGVKQRENYLRKVLKMRTRDGVFYNFCPSLLSTIPDIFRVMTSVPKTLSPRGLSMLFPFSDSCPRIRLTIYGIFQNDIPQKSSEEQENFHVHSQEEIIEVYWGSSSLGCYNIDDIEIKGNNSRTDEKDENVSSFENILIASYPIRTLSEEEKAKISLNTLPSRKTKRSNGIHDNASSIQGSSLDYDALQYSHLTRNSRTFLLPLLPNWAWCQNTQLKFILKKKKIKMITVESRENSSSKSEEIIVDVEEGEESMHKTDSDRYPFSYQSSDSHREDTPLSNIDEEVQIKRESFTRKRKTIEKISTYFYEYREVARIVLHWPTLSMVPICRYAHSVTPLETAPEKPYPAIYKSTLLVPQLCSNNSVSSDFINVKSTESTVDKGEEDIIHPVSTLSGYELLYGLRLDIGEDMNSNYSGNNNLHKVPPISNALAIIHNKKEKMVNNSSIQLSKYVTSQGYPIANRERAILQELSTMEETEMKRRLRLEILDINVAEYKKGDSGKFSLSKLKSNSIYASTSKKWTAKIYYNDQYQSTEKNGQNDSYTTSSSAKRCAISQNFESFKEKNIHLIDLQDDTHLKRSTLLAKQEGLYIEVLTEDGVDPVYSNSHVGDENDSYLLEEELNQRRFLQGFVSLSYEELIALVPLHHTNYHCQISNQCNNLSTVVDSDGIILQLQGWQLPRENKNYLASSFDSNFSIPCSPIRSFIPGELAPFSVFVKLSLEQSPIQYPHDLAIFPTTCLHLPNPLWANRGGTRIPGDGVRNLMTVIASGPDIKVMKDQCRHSGTTTNKKFISGSWASTELRKGRNYFDYLKKEKNTKTNKKYYTKCDQRTNNSELERLQNMKMKREVNEVKFLLPEDSRIFEGQSLVLPGKAKAFRNANSTITSFAGNPIFEQQHDRTEAYSHPVISTSGLPISYLYGLPKQQQNFPHRENHRRESNEPLFMTPFMDNKIVKQQQTNRHSVIQLHLLDVGSFTFKEQQKFIKIQAYIRGWIARRKFFKRKFVHLYYEKQTRILARAAMLFSATMRKRRRNKAAILITKIVKGYVTRKKLKKYLLANSSKLKLEILEMCYFDPLLQDPEFESTLRNASPYTNYTSAAMSNIEANVCWRRSDFGLSSYVAPKYVGKVNSHFHSLSSLQNLLDEKFSVKNTEAIIAPRNVLGPQYEADKEKITEFNFTLNETLGPYKELSIDMGSKEHQISNESEHIYFWKCSSSMMMTLSVEIKRKDPDSGQIETYQGQTNLNAEDLVRMVTIDKKFDASSASPVGDSSNSYYKRKPMKTFVEVYLYPKDSLADEIEEDGNDLENINAENIWDIVSNEDLDAEFTQSEQSIKRRRSTKNSKQHLGIEKDISQKRIAVGLYLTSKRGLWINDTCFTKILSSADDDINLRDMDVGQSSLSSINYLSDEPYFPFTNKKLFLLKSENKDNLEEDGKLSSNFGLQPLFDISKLFFEVSTLGISFPSNSFSRSGDKIPTLVSCFNFKRNNDFYPIRFRPIDVKKMKSESELNKWLPSSMDPQITSNKTSDDFDGIDIVSIGIYPCKRECQNSGLELFLLAESFYSQRVIAYSFIPLNELLSWADEEKGIGVVTLADKGGLGGPVHLELEVRFDEAALSHLEENSTLNVAGSSRSPHSLHSFPVIEEDVPLDDDEKANEDPKSELLELEVSTNQKSASSSNDETKNPLHHQQDQQNELNIIDLSRGSLPKKKPQPPKSKRPDLLWDAEKGLYYIINDAGRRLYRVPKKKEGQGESDQQIKKTG